MSVYKYKAFKSGSKVSRLIIFLHGYNSCIEDVEPFAEMLLQHLDNTLVVMPEADTQSERNPLKKQWYALVDVDPDRKRRKPETPTDEIVEIYNRTGPRISETAKKMNAFISSLQKELKIKNKDTYVMGFSQGAMLAMYVGLTRKYELGGVFPFCRHRLRQRTCWKKNWHRGRAFICFTARATFRCSIRRLTLPRNGLTGTILTGRLLNTTALSTA